MTGALRAAGVLSIVLTMGGCWADDGNWSTSASSTSDGSATNTAPETETETGDEPGPSLVEIPGATFLMGCGVDDAHCDDDNAEHEVTVSSFSLERTEVSAGAYRACVDAGSCTSTPNDPNCNLATPGRDAYPINCVTWQQAVDYCTFVGRRLPTEAEWELAAAGPDNRTFPWGFAEASCMYAHMFQPNGGMGGYGCLSNLTARVENYEDGASIDGVLQLAGNVDEWVSDWYGVDYYASGETMDPQGPADGTGKVNRGGDFLDASPLNLRVFERRQNPPDEVVYERGFRCAL
jgi:formylglycine-generating enzyme required for sulfatase activity